MSGAANSCANCALYLHQIDLQSRSIAAQAEANAVLSARLRAAEMELGRRVAAERLALGMVCPGVPR